MIFSNKLSRRNSQLTHQQWQLQCQGSDASQHTVPSQQHWPLTKLGKHFALHTRFNSWHVVHHF